MMTKSTKNAVTPRKFCEIWEASESADEAARRTGLSVRVASDRACRYRKAGIPLKLMRRGGGGAHRLDVPALSRLVTDSRAR